MNYKCESCSTCYAGNDGCVHSVLPADVAGGYLVLPRYTAGQFHLQKDLSGSVELLMKMYANGRFISSKLYPKLGVCCTRKIGTYFSLSPMHRFVSYDTFTFGVTPPAAASIRASFDDAENSTLTPYRFSHFDCYEREMHPHIFVAGCGSFWLVRATSGAWSARSTDCSMITRA
jgi:hypothetical protein